MPDLLPHNVGSPANDGRSKPTILVVDDDPDVLKMGILVLRDEFNVLSANSVAEASAILAERKDFKCVLTDWDMPDGNGGDVIATAREQNPGIKTIVISGGGNPDEIAAANPDASFGKPFEIVAVIAKIWELIGGTRPAVTTALAGSAETERGAEAAKAPRLTTVKRRSNGS